MGSVYQCLVFVYCWNDTKLGMNSGPRVEEELKGLMFSNGMTESGNAGV